MRNVCGLNDDPRSGDTYDDTCANHPNGCHVRLLSPGVEFHETPAYAHPPMPGALEAESFDAQIEQADLVAKSLRISRQQAHDERYKAANL